MTSTGRPAQPIHAPRGATRSCRGWGQEAALRMLMNNLDPDVAERWEDLVVYGGGGEGGGGGGAPHPRAGPEPLAVTMNDGVGLFVEVDGERIERRLRLRYVDRATTSLDEALAWAEEARRRREPLSIALHGNAAEIHPEIARRGVRPDVVTDQTSAHDMLTGYIPAGLTPAAAAELRGRGAKAGPIFNDLVASGRVKAPIVIGRAHLDSGSVASPNRETESMRDGSDAIADWPILNALLNTAAGATWVSVHHGGGVGIGYSIHAGMGVAADGTPDAAPRLQRVLPTNPGPGTIRPAAPGYPQPTDRARGH